MKYSVLKTPQGVTRGYRCECCQAFYVKLPKVCSACDTRLA